MNKAVKSIVCGVAAMFAASAMAAVPASITKFVPETMNYQGYLANPSTGAAYVDGIYDLDCRLCRQASGGTAIWGARYSVYVKGGYFNIMLGDSSGVRIYSTADGSSYPTYGVAELWKALYYDSSVSEKNNLWLGVTPRQNATLGSIADPREISPRQQLLAAPYAFRAQSAQYANASQGDFSVGGNLSVTGSLSFNANYLSLGSYVRSNESAGTLNLGGTTSNSSSNPSVSTYANNINNYAYNSQTFYNYNGGMDFTVPSTKSYNFKGGSFAVTNSATGSVISMKSRNITLDGTYDGVTIKGYPPAKITTDTDVVITGRYNYISAAQNHLRSTSNLYLQPATNADIRAQGHLYWQPAGFGSAAFSPIRIKKVTLTFSASTTRATYSLTGLNMFKWTVGGFELQGTYSGTAISSCSVYRNGSVWTVEMMREPNGYGYSSSQTYEVTLVGYLNDITNDER